MKNKIYLLGACAIESEGLYFTQAKLLGEALAGKDWYLKGSFDKANRSSVAGERGIGLDEATRLFGEVKKQFPDIKLTTDVHEVWQIEKLAGLIDCIQIPAFLCRQTDLIVEAAKAFPVVNIKKGQWMSPQNMVKGVDKIKSVNPDTQAWVTERGTQFGYSKLLVDFASVSLLKNYFDKVILDCTHSTQQLKDNGRTGGSAELATKYWKVADIFEYDGVFAETHPIPEEAHSDGDSQIPFNQMLEFLAKE